MSDSRDTSYLPLGASALRRVLDVSGVATIELSVDRRIVGFSPRAMEIYKLGRDQLGQPLDECDHFALSMPSLPFSPGSLSSQSGDSQSGDSDSGRRRNVERDCSPGGGAAEVAVGEVLEPGGVEIVLSDNRWFRRHMLQIEYATGEPGWLVAFEDVTDRKILEVRQRAEHQVSELLASAAALDDIAEQMLSIVGESLHASVGLVWLMESDQIHCRFGYASGDAESASRFADVSREYVFAVGEGLPGKAVAERDAQWVSEISTRHWFPRGTVAADCGLQLGIAVPIISGDECLGVLEFFSSLAMQRDEELVGMLCAIGHQVGTFLRRCQADRSLRTEARRNSEILRNALDAIVIMDVDGRIIHFNPAAVEIFGWSASEAQGQLLAELLIPEEYREAHRAALSRYVATGQSGVLGQRLELEAIGKNGERFPVELSIGSGKNMDGSPFFTGYVRDISERRRQEFYLRRSEAFLRRTLDSLYAFVCVCSPDGAVIQVNHAALQVANLAADEVLGQPLWETYWWSYDSGVQHRVKNAVTVAADGGRTRFDVDIRVGSDELMTIDSQFAPMRDDRGNVTHLIFSGTNISQRKQLEEELIDKQAQMLDVLKESEADKAKLRTIFDETSFYVGAIDLKGRLVEINRTSLERGGFQRDEVIDRPFWETVWWSGSREVQNRIREALNRVFGGATFQDELPYRTKDGGERMVDLSLIPVCNEHGRVMLVIFTGADITDQKKAQLREQRESERQRFLGHVGTALGSSLDYETTLKRVVDLCVPTLADWAFLDLLNEEGIARRVAIAHRHPGHKELADRIASYSTQPSWYQNPPARGLFGAQGSVIPDFTDQMIHEAAEDLEHEAVIRAVGPKSILVVPLVARGSVFGALTLIATDDRRAYDEDDLRFAEELAGRSAMAIDNARLYQKGQQANRAKSEFIANTSHEIRTPLTAVLGYTDLLLEGEVDSEKIRFLETIRRNGHFLLNILNDVLDFSKIESGKMAILRERVDVTSVVEDVRLMMAPRAEARELEFAVVYEGRLPEFIYSDPDRIRQILINLVGNAIKFTAEGKIGIHIRELRRADSSLIEFRVTDSGIGIGEQQLRRLFSPFDQGDASVSRRFGGSGLGLAISQKLAMLLGGEVVVESQLGQGSTFIVRIATEADESVERRDPNESRPAVEQRLPNQRKLRLNCRVLVVDDRRDVRFLVGHILTRNGASVEYCEDGLEACEFIKKRLADKQLPNLILLDMQMPRMDGYQTAKTLREMGFEKPIIALTADALHGDMHKCLESGCDSYLSKPINTSDLVELVVRFTAENVTDP